MQEKIENLIKEALKNLDIEDVDFVVEHPEDLKNGDYSTNVAMVCAKKLKNPPAGGPKELAEKITNEMSKTILDTIEKIEIAGAGFINFYLSRKFFAGSIEEILNNENFGKNRLFSGKKVMVEYTDPNPFKPFHIGHLMTNTIGESIARILEYSGAIVSRANYQGDIGLHVAKAIFGLMADVSLQNKDIPNVLQSVNIGRAYAMGSEAYTDHKHEIDEINKKIYSRSDEKINEIYDWGFKVTMEAFEDIYDMLGTQFDLYFLESQMAPAGEKIVRENIGKIFTESNAVDFISWMNKYGPILNLLAVISLAVEKFKIIPDMSLSIVITANEQADYMRVVAKAISLIKPEYENKMKHITHGMMRFSDGKMSSRKGNVITGETLIADTKILVSEKIKGKDFTDDDKEKIISEVAVAAVKYSILKQSIGGDIMYDFEKSISFEGDSGPYLQYSHARANSVLEKAKSENILPDPHMEVAPEEVFEVEKLLYQFPEVVRRSVEEYEPHHIANYLIELARTYNSFYGNTVIVNKDDKTSSYKVALTYAFSFVMKRGLHLLGIEAPVKM